MSFEDFDRLWTNHGALIRLSITPVKTGVVKYRQFHIVPQMSAVVEGRGLPVAKYDAVAEWEAESLEEILEIFVSDEYKEKLRPDEAKFFYRESVQVMVGRDQSDFGQYRPDLE